VRDNDFLFEIKEGHYLILPGSAGVSQEESMAGIALTGVGLKTVRIAQKDGSRLVVIRPSSLTPRDIVIRIAGAMRERKPIWIETKITKEDLTRKLESGELGPHNCSFYAYRLNRFLNGSRVCLLLVKEGNNTFYDAGVLGGKVPEDSLGLFVESDAELGLSLTTEDRVAKIWKADVIDHLSRIRLCSKCLCVSDHGAEKTLPWLGWGNATQNLERIKTGDVYQRGGNGAMKLRDFDAEAEARARKKAEQKLARGPKPQRDPITGEYPPYAYVPTGRKRGRPKSVSES